MSTSPAVLYNSTLSFPTPPQKPTLHVVSRDSLPLVPKPGDIVTVKVRAACVCCGAGSTVHGHNRRNPHTESTLHARGYCYPRLVCVCMQQGGCPSASTAVWLDGVHGTSSHSAAVTSPGVPQRFYVHPQVMYRTATALTVSLSPCTQVVVCFPVHPFLRSPTGQPCGADVRPHAHHVRGAASAEHRVQGRHTVGLGGVVGVGDSGIAWGAWPRACCLLSNTLRQRDGNVGTGGSGDGGMGRGWHGRAWGAERGGKALSTNASLAVLRGGASYGSWADGCVLQCLRWARALQGAQQELPQSERWLDTTTIGPLLPLPGNKMCVRRRLTRWSCTTASGLGTSCAPRYVLMVSKHRPTREAGDAAAASRMELLTNTGSSSRASVHR